MVEVQPEMPAWEKAYGRPCLCKGSKSQKRLRYIQPERPESFRPVKLFMPSETKMDNGTTYKLSYEGFDSDVIKSCKPIPTITRENLISAGEFSGSTTQRMSYGAWMVSTKRDPLRVHKDHKLLGEGPMQDLTTHKHDYTPKPFDKAKKFQLQENLGFSKEPMSHNSVTNMSYRCPNYKAFEPSPSFKPETRYAPPNSPLEGNTIQKLSYLPWEPLPKEEISWGKPGVYLPPKVPFIAGTIYKGSFSPPGRIVEDDDGHVKGCYCAFPKECDKADDMYNEKLDTCPSTYDLNQDHLKPSL